MFKINIKGNLERIGDNNMLTGRICVSLSERCFPDESWDDFIETILIEWANEVCSNNEQKKNGKLIFFDGPYLIVYEISDLVMNLYCTSYDEGFVLDHIPVEKRNECLKVDFLDFLSELQSAIRTLIETLTHQPIPHDITNLSFASRKLELIINSDMNK